MLAKPPFKEPQQVKILFNVGALLDIPSGTYLTGKHGESILNGGYGIMTGVIGMPNSFKSTFTHFMMFAAASTVYEVTDTNMNTYCTEMTTHEGKLRTLSAQFPAFSSTDIFEEGVMSITDKTMHPGDEWYDLFKKYLRDKKDSTKNTLLKTPFLTRDKTNMMITPPTFGGIDSLTYFETSDVTKMQDDNMLGESGGNTIHMRQGLAKTRMFMELPALVMGCSHFIFFTAHIGKESNIQVGPMNVPPPKKLSTMKQGDKVKGATDAFLYLMSNLWQLNSATPLLNQTTKGPEYPVRPDDPQPGDLDLYTVMAKLLRSKSGPSGGVFEIVISQSRGVLPTLTEFHFLKSKNDRFGMDGSRDNFHMVLYPQAKLTRPNVRSKIDTDPMLRRAIRITSELCQMHLMWRHLDPRLLCTPKQLYDDLIALGYDWNVLLNTRGYWVFNNEDHPVPFLSTMDLLKMRIGLYKPYWLNEQQG